MIAARLRESFDALAKARQVATQSKPGLMVGSHVVENFPPPEATGKSRDKAGESMQVSGKSVDMASKVLSQGVRAIRPVDIRGRQAAFCAVRCGEAGNRPNETNEFASFPSCWREFVGELPDSVSLGRRLIGSFGGKKSGKIFWPFARFVRLSRQPRREKRGIFEAF